MNEASSRSYAVRHFDATTENRVEEYASAEARQEIHRRVRLGASSLVHMFNTGGNSYAWKRGEKLLGGRYYDLYLLSLSDEEGKAQSSVEKVFRGAFLHHMQYVGLEIFVYRLIAKATPPTFRLPFLTQPAFRGSGSEEVSIALQSRGAPLNSCQLLSQQGRFGQSADSARFLLDMLQGLRWLYAQGVEIVGGFTEDDILVCDGGATYILDLGSWTPTISVQVPEHWEAGMAMLKLFQKTLPEKGTFSAQVAHLKSMIPMCLEKGACDNWDELILELTKSS